jgi:hypothetical protein
MFFEILVCVCVCVCVIEGVKEISQMGKLRQPLTVVKIYDVKIFFFGFWGYLHCTPGLLCQPRVIVKMIVEKQMEWRLAGKFEVLGENLPQRNFCPSQNPTWLDPCLNPGRRGGKPETNR